MDRTASSTPGLQVGTGLTAVFWDANRARAERAIVFAEAPFYVACPNPTAHLDKSEPGLLLWTQDGEVLASDVRTTEVTEVDGQTVVGMDLQGWRKIDDRRRSPRISHTGSVAIRRYRFEDEITVTEPTYGRIVDLSMSGSLIVVPDRLQVGQVLEFRAILEPGKPVSVLGVVTRRDEATGGYGVAFLEFVGTGEEDLRTYLKRAG